MAADTTPQILFWSSRLSSFDHGQWRAYPPHVLDLYRVDLVGRRNRDIVAELAAAGTTRLDDVQTGQLKLAYVQTRAAVALLLLGFAGGVFFRRRRDGERK